jgi:hypothetical protein
VENRGWRRQARQIPKFESAYERRRGRHRAQAAGEGDDGGVGPCANAAHLAGALALFGVVHGADLSWQQARAAFLVVSGGGHILATERERRSGDVRDLAQ